MSIWDHDTANIKKSVNVGNKTKYQNVTKSNTKQTYQEFFSDS